MLRNFPILGFALASVLEARAWPNLSLLPSSNSILGIGKHKECPPFNKGNFTIDYFQLYPENADWDAHSCQVIFGSLWNGSVAIYNPYLSQITQSLTFPGVTNTGTYHIGGVAFDPLSNLYTILTDPAAAWDTEGGDLRGDHLLIKYNPITNHTLWTLNLTTLTHERYGGFQDVETDRRGNTYVVGTFPGTILRADKHGREIKEWYLPDPFPTVTPGTPFAKGGFGGLAAVPGTEILLSNDGDGQIYRFDMRADRGHPVAVPITPKVLYNDTDAIYLPPKYGGSVLLVASHGSGVQVLRSRDKRWERAEYVGTVEVEYPRDEEFPQGEGVTVAVTQIGPSGLYVILGFGDLPWVEERWRAGGGGFRCRILRGKLKLC
ncbi:trichothecene biosynthesis enzyme [Neurospora tetraspora]|uniref:Trichothecene biosynthesis enzyme n=1 Tax=Neurospora tetraspora TaxID=94610 RepID=A0AAE0MSQ6_9PEZI|nr:trichothecene biosynthesis enzyme [Neurospora tetraspora]